MLPKENYMSSIAENKYYQKTIKNSIKPNKLLQTLQDKPRNKLRRKRKEKILFYRTNFKYRRKERLIHKAIERKNLHKSYGIQLICYELLKFYETYYQILGR
jgi:hypothetical protein